WKLFKRKIERKYSLKLSYLGVVEFQERGAIHFHICLFNVPYLKHSELYEMWSSTCGSGGVYIEKIGANDCDNVGAYITKYLSKDMDDFFDNEYKGKKRYFKSRGLKEPEVIKYNAKELVADKEGFEQIMENLKDNVVYEYESKPFDITKKSRCYEQVPIMETVEVVDFEGKKTFEETNIKNRSVEILDLYGNKKIVDRSFEWVEVEFGQKEKELNETFVAVQQLKYKQIVLNKNNLYRSNTNIK
ncbi:MAG: rolling circle replication-associated protein, partial [Metamycoplasmataceae bacterium]